MRTTLWKFEVDGRGVEMPQGARIISCGVQQTHPTSEYDSVERMVIWAVVDRDAPRVLRKIRVVGTGAMDGEDRSLFDAPFIGTVTLFARSRAPLYFHLFDLGESKDETSHP